MDCWTNIYIRGILINIKVSKICHVVLFWSLFACATHVYTTKQTLYKSLCTKLHSCITGFIYLYWSNLEDSASSTRYSKLSWRPRRRKKKRPALLTLGMWALDVHRRNKSWTVIKPNIGNKRGTHCSLITNERNISPNDFRYRHFSME